MNQKCFSIFLLSISLSVNTMEKKPFTIQEFGAGIQGYVAQFAAPLLLKEVDPLDHKSIIAVRSKIVGYNEVDEKEESIYRQTLPKTITAFILNQFTSLLQKETHWTIQPYWRYYGVNRAEILKFSFSEDMKACALMHNNRKIFRVSFFDKNQKKYEMDGSTLPALAISDDHERVACFGSGQLHLFEKKKKGEKGWTFEEIKHVYPNKERASSSSYVLFLGNDTLICKTNKTLISDIISILSKNNNKWNQIQHLNTDFPHHSKIKAHLNSEQNNNDIFWVQCTNNEISFSDMLKTEKGQSYYLKYVKDQKTNQWLTDNKRIYNEDIYFEGPPLFISKLKGDVPGKQNILGLSKQGESTICLALLIREKDNLAIMKKRDSNENSPIDTKIFTCPRIMSIKHPCTTVRLMNNHIVIPEAKQVACSDHQHSLPEIILKTAIEVYKKDKKTIPKLSNVTEKINTFPARLQKDRETQLHSYILDATAFLEDWRSLKTIDKLERIAKHRITRKK